MKVLLLTCAQGISIDARLSSASLFHVIEDVTVAVFPSVLPPFTVYALVEKEPGDADTGALTLTIALDGEVLSENGIAVDFAGKSRAHLSGELQGFMLPRTGVLKFSLTDRGRELSCWNVPVQSPVRPGA